MMHQKRLSENIRFKAAPVRLSGEARFIGIYARKVFVLTLTIATLVVSFAPINAKERSPVSQPALRGPAFRFLPPSLINDIEINQSAAAAQQPGGVGYLGVFLGDLTEERARELKLVEVRGAVIGKVEEESPAARAGLAENDVILALNDRQIQNRAQLYRMISATRPGSEVRLTISRDGVQQTVKVELGLRRTGIQDEKKRLYAEADAMLAAAEDRRREAEALRQQGDLEGARRLSEEERLLRSQSEERRAYVEEQIKQGKIKEPAGIQRPTYSISANRFYLGLTVVPINEQLAQYFNTGGSGVLVSEVRAGGTAEKAGIKAGDCIVAVNDDRIRSISDLYRLVDRQGVTEADADRNDRRDSELLLTVIRDRREQKIRLTMETQ